MPEHFEWPLQYNIDSSKIFGLQDYEFDPTVILVTFRHEGLWMSDPFTVTHEYASGRYFLSLEHFELPKIGAAMTTHFIDGDDVLLPFSEGDDDERESFYS